MQPDISLACDGNVPFGSEACVSIYAQLHQNSIRSAYTAKMFIRKRRADTMECLLAEFQIFTIWNRESRE